MITTTSSLVVTECWGNPLTEFQSSINTLQKNNTFNNVSSIINSSQFYLRGEGLYSATTNIVPTPTVTGIFKVTNPSGTYKQMLPSWDSPSMPNGWMGVGTTFTSIGLLENEDDHWLVVEKNGGFVDQSRVAPVSSGSVVTAPKSNTNDIINDTNLTAI